jgi:MAP/microtubule affinity-regulating kinase
MSESFTVQGIKDSYTIYNKVLGKGAYGVVLYAKAVTTGEELAAKIVNFLNKRF